MTPAIRILDPAFASVASLLAEQSAASPDQGAQLVVVVDGTPVVDLAVGEPGTIDALYPVLSVSKGMTGLVIGVLVDRGLIDLDLPVAHYWPAFAAAGKAQVTVSQILSHQGGLAAYFGDTGPSALDDDVVARQLESQAPLWHPGTGFSYHPVTVGALASELCRLTTGMSLATFYESQIRRPRGIDAYLGVPADELPRVRHVDLGSDEAADQTELARIVGESLTGVFALDYLANDPSSHATGQPAAGAVASARGLAQLYATALWDDGHGLLFSPATRATISRPVAVGRDLANGDSRAFATLFQTPTVERPFAAVGAFGHEGAGGAMAYADPNTGYAFAYIPSADPGEAPVDALSAEIARVLHGHRAS